MKVYVKILSNLILYFHVLLYIREAVLKSILWIEVMFKEPKETIYRIISTKKLNSENRRRKKGLDIFSPSKFVEKFKIEEEKEM